MSEKKSKKFIVNLVNSNHQKIAYKLEQKLISLDIDIVWNEELFENQDSIVFDLGQFDNYENISVDFLVEKVINLLPINFDELPLLIEGESKIVKLLNDNIVVEKFKPTVYSYTKNRYGIVGGTEDLRAKFTAEIFRKMNEEKSNENGKKLQNAFLGLIKTSQGFIIAQRKVEPGNLEVRVKRYHIGSPLHRYNYTNKYSKVFGDKCPLKKWDRFEKPIVCFDWRNPLTDDEGNRLSDEPLSDDYASVWMEDVWFAKKLASDTFLWLEQLFYNAGLILVDICFFIDQSGKVIFGEISPDCMRVKEGVLHPKLSDSLAKDLWRNGKNESFLATSYNKLYEIIFEKSSIPKPEQIIN